MYILVIGVAFGVFSIAIAVVRAIAVFLNDSNNNGRVAVCNNAEIPLLFGHDNQ